MCLEWIESIRLENGVLQAVDLHQKRMDRTFLHFKDEPCPFILKDILTQFILPHVGIHKVRVKYNLLKIESIDIDPYRIRDIEDFAFIESEFLDYSFKYADRLALEELKLRSHADEIIIIQNGFITDTSYSNLIFLRNNEWYTPSSYLLNGTMRQKLLLNQSIQEVEIKQADLRYYTHFKLINAMMSIEESISYETNKIKQRQDFK